jgi:hypothetical protein
MLIKSWAGGLGRWNGLSEVWYKVEPDKVFQTFQSGFSDEEIAASLDRVSVRDGDRCYVVIRASGPSGYTETLYKDWASVLARYMMEKQDREGGVRRPDNVVELEDFCGS